MLENNDLRLLTLASDNKISSATRQLKDKKLHYESGFPKWLSDVSSHRWPTKGPDMFQRRLETMRFRECTRNFKKGPPFS